MTKGQAGIVCMGIGVALVFPGLTVKPLMVIAIVLMIVGFGLTITHISR